MLRRKGPVKRPWTVESVRREKESLRWEGYVKQMSFKPGVKEWRSYGWGEWWINRRRSDRCRKMWLRDRESVYEVWSCRGRNRELIPETKIERTDQSFVTRMMKVDEREWREMKSECLWGGWTEMRLCRQEGWAVVRTLYASDRNLY